MGHLSAAVDSVKTGGWISPNKDIPQNGHIRVRPINFKPPEEMPAEVKTGVIVYDPKVPFIVAVFIHHISIGSGEEKKHKVFRCQQHLYNYIAKRKGTPVQRCAFCQASEVMQTFDKETSRDLSPRVKMMMNVIHNDMVKVFSAEQATVINPIDNLADAYGNMGHRKLGRSLQIGKTGTGMRTKYTVIALDPKPVDEYTGRPRDLITEAMNNKAIKIAEARAMLRDILPEKAIRVLGW